MYSARVILIKDEIDVDWQLIADDLDTSIFLMRYLHIEDSWDSLKRNQFNELVNDIENVEGAECYSYNDNMILYEYMNEPVIIFTIFENKYIIFDVRSAKVIENKMKNFCIQ